MGTDHGEEVVHPEDVKHPPPPKKDQIAAKMADAASTVWFLLANLLWWAVWVPTKGFGIDSDGGYGILTLLLSFEAIVLTIAVLIQQRLDGHARAREAEADLKNDAIAADEAQEIHEQLDRIEALLKGKMG